MERADTARSGWGAGGTDAEDASTVLQCLELASTPAYVVPHLAAVRECAAAGAPAGVSVDGTVRLARLYWRYLVGSTIIAQLRDAEHVCFLELRDDGRVDLVSFLCVLALEQVHGLFPKGVRPTAELIRKIVMSS